MSSFRIRFIGSIREDELHALKSGAEVISKMLLTPDDFQAFHYAEGDAIEAETPDGNRIWTTIRRIEVIDDSYRKIVILSLTNNQKQPV